MSEALRAQLRVGAAEIGQVTRSPQAGFAAVTALAAAAWLAAGAPLGADYPHDGGPPIRALLDGDASAFFAQQPLMGTFSLLLRAPFAALSSLGDGSELLVYRLGSFACLLAAALLAVYLFRLMGERGQPLLARVTVAALCLLNPMTADALRWGHPEEMLAGALCVAAVILAAHRGWLAAGIVLGLALSTKQWAVIAVIPALLAARRDRIRLLGAAAGMAALLTLPLVLGDPGEFIVRNQSALIAGTDIPSVSVWWPLADTTERTVFDGVERVTVQSYSLPSWLFPVTHPLIVLMPLPLGFLFWRRRRELRAEDALGLLALLFLLRCVLDPVNIGYYHVPFLLALGAYEGLRRRGLPVLTMLAATALWITFAHVQELRDEWLTWGVYMAWSLPLAGLLTVLVLAPRSRERLSGRFGRHARRPAMKAERADHTARPLGIDY